MRIRETVVSLALLFASVALNAQNLRAIQGRVVNSDGVALAGADLSLKNYSETFKADEYGNFTLRVPYGYNYVTASYPDHISVTLEVDGSFLLFKLKYDATAVAKREAQLKKEAEAQAKAEAAAKKARDEEEKARLAQEQKEAERVKKEMEQQAKAEAAALKAKADEERAQAEQARKAAERAQKEAEEQARRMEALEAAARVGSTAEPVKEYKERKLAHYVSGSFESDCLMGTYALDYKLSKNFAVGGYAQYLKGDFYHSHSFATNVIANATSVVLGLDFKAYLMKTRIKPFIDSRIGYGISIHDAFKASRWGDDFNHYDAHEYTGLAGPCGAVDAGVDFSISRGLGAFAAIGISMHKLSAEVVSNDSNYTGQYESVPWRGYILATIGIRF